MMIVYRNRRLDLRLLFLVMLLTFVLSGCDCSNSGITTTPAEAAAAKVNNRGGVCKKVNCGKHGVCYINTHPFCLCDRQCSTSSSSSISSSISSSNSIAAAIEESRRSLNKKLFSRDNEDKKRNNRDDKKQQSTSNKKIYERLIEKSKKNPASFNTFVRYTKAKKSNRIQPKQQQQQSKQRKSRK